MRTKADVVIKMYDKLWKIGHTAPELTLARACLGLATVTRMLRGYGDELEAEGDTVRRYEEVVEGTLNRLAPGLTADG